MVEKIKLFTQCKRNPGARKHHLPRYYKLIKVLTTALLVVLTLTPTIVEDAHAALFIEWDCKKNESERSCAINNRILSIYLYDEIDKETAYDLAYLDGLLSPNQKFPKVYINSFGGSINSAVMIGRILRRRNASIESKNFLLPNKNPQCSSACVFIAAGATKRQISHLGLHTPYKEKHLARDRIRTSEVSKTEIKEILSYFDEMGINPTIKSLILRTPSNEIQHFTINETKPLAEQTIVKLGFHPQKIDITSAKKLNKLLPDQYDRVEALKKVAATGDVKAAKKLGDIYFNGIDGHDKWISEAIRWYQKASDLGDIHITHYLGVIYSNGLESIPIDKAKAASYFRKAAEAGLAGSQNNLGYAYYTGKGVPKNNILATYWVTRAAEQGEPFAYGTLGQMYYDGGVFPKNNVETYKWLTLAVSNMPDGKAKKEDAGRLGKITKRMSTWQIKKGEELVQAWTPLKQSQYLMGNIDN